MSAASAAAGGLTLAEVAAGAGVSPATVRRWVAGGLVPQYEGAWTPGAAAHVRIVARLRARGHSLEEIRVAGEEGRLAVGPIENLLSRPGGRHTAEEAAREAGLTVELLERIYANLGLSALSLDALSDDDVEMLRYIAAMLEAGLPEQVFIQLVRVYGQALAQIADAEVRLIHMYVHEPLMREGVPGLKIAEQMEGLVSEVLPFTVPLMDYTHGRLLAHFVEQDVVGHMEADPDGLDEGRLRVVIAFADLAGYTRLTEERGDEEELGAVERFLESVERTLPIDARVIKTLGDEVMIVGSEPLALTEWAVEFQEQRPERLPPPRIGIHYGEALYRDGDYYGREVNQAARVVARADAAEVLVTRVVAEAVDGADGLVLEPIGEVGLKGFSRPTELFVATRRER
ncbi:MAG: guanylate cyclase [Solirubrobacterales bacterium]|nr:guanylate cyclase [Solirubrobacterales bacterium]